MNQLWMKICIYNLKLKKNNQAEFLKKTHEMVMIVK